MKVLQTLYVMALLIFSFTLQAQDRTIHKVRFVTKIDIQQATKDGIYLNGYVVNIPYHTLQQLNGQTVRIKGRVTIIKGLKNYKDGIVRQGREEDSKHILKPRIKVIKDDQ